MGKPPDGMMEGVLAIVGAYDQCLDTVAFTDETEEEVQFKGKYCTVQLSPNFDFVELFHNFSHATSVLKQYLPYGNVSLVFPSENCPDREGNDRKTKMAADPPRSELCTPNLSSFSLSP